MAVACRIELSAEKRKCVVRCFRDQGPLQRLFAKALCWAFSWGSGRDPLGIRGGSVAEVGDPGVRGLYKTLGFGGSANTTVRLYNIKKGNETSVVGSDHDAITRTPALAF